MICILFVINDPCHVNIADFINSVRIPPLIVDYGCSTECTSLAKVDSCNRLCNHKTWSGALRFRLRNVLPVLVRAIVDLS